MKKKNGVLLSIGSLDMALLETNPQEFWKDVEVIAPAAFTFNGEKTDYIKIPSTVKRIERQAFPEISNFKKIEIEKGVEYVGPGNISGYRLKELVIPSSVELHYSQTEYYRLCYSYLLEKKDGSIAHVFFATNEDKKNNGEENYIQVKPFYKVFSKQMETFHIGKFIENQDATRVLIRVIKGMDELGISNNFYKNAVNQHIYIPTEIDLNGVFDKNHSSFLEFVNSLQEDATTILSNQAYFKLYNLALKLGLLEDKDVLVNINGLSMSSREIAKKVLYYAKKTKTINLTNMDMAAFYAYDEEYLKTIIKSYGIDKILEVNKRN